MDIILTHIARHRSDFGVAMGDGLTKAWFNFFGELFVRFRDGYDITADKNDPECGCNVGGKGYPAAQYERIVAETGDQYLELGGGGGDHLQSGEEALVKHKTKSKMSLKSLN